MDIAVASEVMAILALTTSLADLRQRLGRIVIAESYDGKLITAEDLKCAGAMAVLLKDAIKPTLMQTIENTPCLVHTGPFANIAHGNSSILADLIGRKCAHYVITESGFGADMGCEKFMNIKCRSSGLTPDAVVLVCTVRALKMHSGAFTIVPGKPLDPRLKEENLFLLVKGIPNLEKQIENVLMYGVPVVVAINRFDSDSDAEIEVIRDAAINAGAEDAVVSEVWARGADGGAELAQAVMKAVDKKKQFRFLYELDAPIMEKIETIATKMYGAEEIEYLPLAKRQIRFYEDHGLGNLPICMAKTHLSLTHDPKIKGCPTGFSMPIREIRASIGAGFLYPLVGDIMTMPGLPSVPGGTRIDIDENGKIIGLS
jgi:formyltetrahydrofolate synthetase